MQVLRDIRLFVRETLEFFQDKGHLRVFAALVFLVGVTSLCSAGANGSLRDDQWVSDWLQNFSTEMLGAVVTFVLFIGYIESRQGRMAKQAEEDQRRIAKEAEEEQEKKRLILQMGSPFNEFAVEAARALQARGWGWHEDESLQKAFLAGANLKRAILHQVNLEGANFHKASLQGVGLGQANLRGVMLRSANVQKGDLAGANLQGANLWGAFLQEANLWGANLQGADLVIADLEGTIFERAFLGAVSKAILDETTTLPDGSKYIPQNGLEQLERFTDPDHPEFWRPESDEENKPDDET